MARSEPVRSMERPATDRDVIPLYHRVYVILLQKITDGSYPAGNPIPSEDELAEAFGVSRVTIRKAMDRLEREGRVLRQRGRGTFPLTPEGTGSQPNNALLKNQLSLARKTRVALLEYALVRPVAEMAGLFGIPPEAEVLRIQRIRSDDRSPISHTVCYLPADLAPMVPQNAVSSLPVSATLAQAGIRLSRFEEKITAVLADAALSAHLDVDIGTPLVAMTRQVRDDKGRLIELLQARYRPDRYEYRVEYSIDDQTLGTHWKAMITDSDAS